MRSVCDGTEVDACALAGALFVGLSCAVGCVSVGTFRCDDSSACGDGRCEADGYCSSADDSCESGWRYAAGSGNRAGSCVEMGGPDSGVAVPFPDMVYFDFESVVDGRAINLAGTGISGDVAALSGDGYYGAGVEFRADSIHDVQLIDHETLLPENALTIEAWVRRDREGVLHPVYGDLIPGAEVRTEVQLDISDTDRLRLQVGDGCSGDVATASSTQGVSAGRWHHIAAAWNGATVLFYVDTELAGTSPLAGDICSTSHPYRVGRHGETSTLFEGAMDEIKVSGRALSRDEIALSAQRDSMSVGARCGDHRIEDAEACEHEALCCDLASCSALDGQSCGSGGTCEGTRCAVPGQRTTDGLIALYEFDEGSGTTVSDHSGAAGAMALEIADADQVTWGSDSLTFTGATRAATQGAATWIHDAVDATNELTVEVWFQPTDAGEFGTIVTWDDGGVSANLKFKQVRETYVFQFSSAKDTNSDGRPALATPAGDVGLLLTHAVLVRHADGRRRIYLNGALRTQDLLPGPLSELTSSPFAIGSEVDGDEDWRGSIERLAVFGRALSEEEIAALYASGPSS